MADAQENAVSTVAIDLDWLSRAQLALGAVRAPETFGGTPLSSPGAPLTVISATVDGLVLDDAIGQKLGSEQSVPAVPEALWIKQTNEQRIELNPVGCRFLRDVNVCGSGYLYYGDQIVRDGSHLSDVAVEWVAKPMPDSPLAAPPAFERFVDGLAVVGIAPGHLIYGHWLIDLMPRFRIAKQVLGAEFANARIVMPADTPKWALRLLETFVGVKPEQYEFYRRGIDRLALREACIPTYIHTDYALHPYAREVFAAVGTSVSGGSRKLCISRAGFEKVTNGVQKLFHSRGQFEALAVEYGYELVRPETLSIQQQVALFASATHVVGEYGSGLHSTVFSRPGTRVGYIRCPNQIQLRISALYEQPSVVIIPTDSQIDEIGVVQYSLTNSEMIDFFEANEGSEPGARPLRTPVSYGVTAVDSQSRFAIDMQADEYLSVLKRFHDILKPETYLEIGSRTGDSLKLANCPSIAIDPYFSISSDVIGAKPVCHFYQMPSDRFFRSYNVTEILKTPVQFAFLDGMHLCEFLLRDFINVERVSAFNSVVAMHDCMPSDVYMACRNEGDPIRLQSLVREWWTGDVWKMLWALKKYRPDLTIVSINSPPTGLICVTHLDPASTVLQANYAAIVREMLALEDNDEVLQSYFQSLDMVSPERLMTLEQMSEFFYL